MWGWYFILFLYFKNSDSTLPLWLRSWGAFAMQGIALVQFLAIKKTLYDVAVLDAGRTCPTRDWIDVWMGACIWIGALSIFLMFAFASRFGSPGDKLCYDLLAWRAGDDAEKSAGRPKHLVGCMLAKWVPPTRENEATKPDGTYKFFYSPNADEYGGEENLKLVCYFIMHQPEKLNDADGADGKKMEGGGKKMVKLEQGYFLAQWHHEGPKKGTWTRSIVVPARAAMGKGLPRMAVMFYFFLDLAYGGFGACITFMAMSKSCMDRPSTQIKLMLGYTIAFLLFTTIFGATALTLAYAKCMGLENKATFVRRRKHAPLKVRGCCDGVGGVGGAGGCGDGVVGAQLLWLTRVNCC